jgi:hypothetical protein
LPIGRVGDAKAVGAMSEALCDYRSRDDRGGR